MPTITHGMLNAMMPTDIAHSCMKCNLQIPIYPGRYPKSCPNCNTPLVNDLPYPTPSTDSENMENWEDIIFINKVDNLLVEMKSGKTSLDETMKLLLEN